MNVAVSNRKERDEDVSLMASQSQHLVSRSLVPVSLCIFEVRLANDLFKKSNISVTFVITTAKIEINLITAKH